MKRIVSLSLLSLSSCLVVAQGEVDTVYYSKGGHGSVNKAFADYYRVIGRDVVDGHRRFRDFYIDGHLMSDGFLCNYDADDDKNTVFYGEREQYYRNGGLKVKCRYADGVLDGEYVELAENGNVNLRTNYKRGLEDGVREVYEDGGRRCVRTEYKDGKLLYDYAIVSGGNGCFSKIRIADGTPVYDSPAESEISERYKDGKLWRSYAKNALVVSMACKKIREDGRFFVLDIMVTNNSLFDIELMPEEIKACVDREGGRCKELKVYSYEEWEDKKRRLANWAMALSGVAMGMSSATAGYSTSYTTAPSGYTYVTTTYSPQNAYLAQAATLSSLSEIEKNLTIDRVVRSLGYAQRTTLIPGEALTGFVMVDRKHGDTLRTSIEIMGVTYNFTWQF